jgi:hypothetical protein
MTAKRFVIFQDSYDDLYIQDKEVYRATGIKVGNEEDIKYENVLKIVELLNELHEENKQLRHDATILIQANQDYRKENERLRRCINEIYTIARLEEV